MTITDIGDIEMPRIPVASAERIVAVGHAGHVHLIDMNTGRTLWTRALASEAGASACEGKPVSVGIMDDIVLAGSMGHVFGLGLDDGTVLWHADHRARGDGETSLAFGAPGGDYVARLET